MFKHFGFLAHSMSTSISRFPLDSQEGISIKEDLHQVFTVRHGGHDVIGGTSLKDLPREQKFVVEPFKLRGDQSSHRTAPLRMRDTSCSRKQNVRLETAPPPPSSQRRAHLLLGKTLRIWYLRHRKWMNSKLISCISRSGR